MLEFGFILIGVILLFLVFIFKKQINKFYDNTKGLSENHAKFYKNVVIYLVPVIFILTGVVLLTVSKLDENTKQTIVNNFESNGLTFNFIGGILLILFGIVTIVVKSTKYRYKAFAKLSVMEENYGKIWGNIIHFCSYSLVPIVLGIYLIWKTLL